MLPILCHCVHYKLNINCLSSILHAGGRSLFRFQTTVLQSKRVDFFLLCMHTYFDLQCIEIALLAAVLVCKASNKPRFVTEAMTNDDVGLVSRALCIAIQTIKKCMIEGYGRVEVSF